MSESNALWHAAFRKEAMDLLEKLWTTLDDQGRNTLAAALLAGPSKDVLAKIDEGEREKSRDRRIFDRIVVLERLREPPLTPALFERMAVLRERYPEWRSAPGERAHFGSWMEMRWGPDTRFSVDDLTAMGDTELIQHLLTDEDRREGLLHTWSQLATAQPQRALDVLKGLATANDPGPPDVWESALMGVRGAENAAFVFDDVMEVLTRAPEALFKSPDVVHAISDFLEARSRKLSDGDVPASFWTLFDRALDAASNEPIESVEEEQNPDWVSRAINHSLGRIATAFMNALFARRRLVGERLPVDFSRRADHLMSVRKINHRLARVIGASRISYLYAIDPEWTSQTLLPSFNWEDEEESIAVWQGYAWHARIDPQLWGAIKPYFFPLFNIARLERMGEWGRSIAQLLMLVGIVFNTNELERDTVREAIRAMSDEMREHAAEWIASYIEAGEQNNKEDHNRPAEGSQDKRWTERVWPWLSRVWPAEVSLRSAGVAEQFALAVIATDNVFPEAVKAIQNFSMKISGSRLFYQLNASSHPDRHPEATLELIEAFIVRDQVGFSMGYLAEIMERIGAAKVEVLDNNIYRQWTELIKQH